MATQQFDYVIIGAGITGLAIARSLLNCRPNANIAIFEKESQLGMHGSGRNSGVLHSGIYYPEASLKAKFCAQGSKALAEFCAQHNLPLVRMGKVVVPTTVDQDYQVDTLYNRGINNGANVRIVDAVELSEIEPEASSASGRALYSPDTSVIDPVAVLTELQRLLIQQGVQFFFQHGLMSTDQEKGEFLTTQNLRVKYGTLFNAAGQYADKIAHLFNTGMEYTMLPFKGMYFSLDEASNIRLNGLVYPAPDLNVPFLGVHSVKKVSGEIYFGPTAIPAMGRENYYGVHGLEPIEALKICKNLTIQYWKNNQGFRNYAHDEAGRFLKSRFADAARALIPRLQTEHLVKSKKVGIRAQLLNLRTRQLEMDFLVHRHLNTVHVLNAVSPAFTSSFPFADYIVFNSLNSA